MRNKLPSLLKSTLAITALSVASTGAYAVGAVGTSALGTGILNMDTTTITQNFANSDVQSYTSNPALDSAGWGHQGSWYTFHTHMGAEYQITATASGDITPGITVWKTDGAFDGGTAGTGETSSASKGVPHSLNQVGNAGDYGLWWATDDSITTTAGGGAVGNTASGITELIGYANDGATQNANGWGGTVLSDGSADGLALINFTSMMHSDYLIFVGGADGTDTGGTINLSVSQVPVPAAVYLFGSHASGKERHVSDVDIGLLLNYKHSKSSENFKMYFGAPPLNP